MLNDFVLAVALICPSANEVAVQEILTPKPIPFAECDKMTQDEAAQAKWRQDKGDCEQDLICVRVYWKGEPE